MLGVGRFRIALLSVLFCLVFGFLYSVLAESICVEWDRNPEDDVAGYRIHYGIRSRLYTSTIDVGDTTEFTITDLENGSMYFFAVSAYDSAGNESLKSDEIYI